MNKQRHRIYGKWGYYAESERIIFLGDGYGKQTEGFGIGFRWTIQSADRKART